MPSARPRRSAFRGRRLVRKSAAWLVFVAAALYVGFSGHAGVLDRSQKEPLEAVLSVAPGAAPNLEPPLGPSALGLAAGGGASWRVKPTGGPPPLLLDPGPDAPAGSESPTAAPAEEETPAPGPPASAVEAPTPQPEAGVAAVPHPVAPAPQQPTPVPPTPVPVQAVGLSAAEQQLLTLHNAERVRAGLAPLTVDTRLETVARRRAADMATRGYFSHISPTGDTAFTLMAALGITGVAAAENIAYNSMDDGTTIMTAMNGFLSSPAHRGNILSGQYTCIGVAAAVSPSGMKYYVVVFAAL